MHRHRTSLACGVLVAALSASGSGRANGVFPAASQLVADPSDPDHLVLRATFGLLTSRDRGASWHWLCEAGMNYKDVLPPMAVLPGGNVLLAVPGGVSHSDASACDFSLTTDFDAPVLDLARSPDEDGGAVAVTLAGTETSLWRTHDGGASFARVGNAIAGLIVATVDVAPSDARVVYLSGTSQAHGVLLRSLDAGRSFEAFDVPDTSPTHRPYIAAVDPTDANVVYVRLDGTPSELQVTRDGGETFQLLLSTEVPALGFALAPDGKTVIASNSFDGTFRADTTDYAFEKVACGGPTCLAFGSDGLYGCGDERVDGYIVGRSDDLGTSFEPVLDLSCVAGPPDCGSDTSVGSVCPLAWPAVQDQLGAATCAPQHVPAYTGCFGSEEGGAGGADGSAGAAPGNTGTPVAHAAGSGCDCRVGRGARGWAWPLGVVLAPWVVRRAARLRRRRA